MRWAAGLRRRWHRAALRMGAHWQGGLKSTIDRPRGATRERRITCCRPRAPPCSGRSAGPGRRLRRGQARASGSPVNPPRRANRGFAGGRWADRPAFGCRQTPSVASTGHPPRKNAIRPPLAVPSLPPPTPLGEDGPISSAAIGAHANAMAGPATTSHAGRRPPTRHWAVCLVLHCKLALALQWGSRQQAGWVGRRPQQQHLAAATRVALSPHVGRLPACARLQQRRLCARRRQACKRRRASQQLRQAAA